MNTTLFHKKYLTLLQIKKNSIELLGYNTARMWISKRNYILPLWNIIKLSTQNQLTWSETRWFAMLFESNYLNKLCLVRSWNYFTKSRKPKKPGHIINKYSKSKMLRSINRLIPKDIPRTDKRCQHLIFKGAMLYSKIPE